MRRASTTQTCSIARTLDIIGDYWSLMVLREAFSGVRRFDGFQAGTGAATNVLSARLHHLVTHEVLEKRRYQTCPERFEYVLTERGQDLFQVLQSLMRWGDKWLSGPDGPPMKLTHAKCGQPTSPGEVCSACGEALEPGSLEVTKATACDGDVR